MKSFSILLSIPELQEMRDVLWAIISTTDVYHELTYAELCSFYKGYMKLVNKCQNKIFHKQNKKYKIPFIPHEAEAMMKVLLKNKRPLTPYAKQMAMDFFEQITKQSTDLKQTFLSQHPFVERELTNH